METKKERELTNKLSGEFRYRRRKHYEERRYKWKETGDDNETGS